MNESNTEDSALLASMDESRKPLYCLIGVFDYTYEDGVEHFEDDNRDYVVLYELRTQNDPQMKESRNVYDSLYIYPVTKESFKRYWESDGQDLSLLKMYEGKYIFNKPSTEIYPKPEDKIISDEQAFTFHIENIEILIHNALFQKYGNAPDIFLERIYLKDGLLRIPDIFYFKEPNSQFDFQIYTLTSNTLWDSEEGLPNSIESIGRFAFANCKYRFKSLPSNLKEVGSKAFMGCDISIKTLPENTIFNSDSLHGTNVYGLSYIDMEKHFPEGAEGITFLWRFIFDDELELKLSKGHKSQFISCKFYINVKLVTDDEVIPSSCFEDCFFYRIKSISENVEKIMTGAFLGCGQVQYSSNTASLRQLFEDLGKREFKHNNYIPIQD